MISLKVNGTPRQFDGKPDMSLPLYLRNVATVVEVEGNSQGEIKIPRADYALDAGLVVNPESTRPQFEGAAVFGVTVVRSGEITARNGSYNNRTSMTAPSRESTKCRCRPMFVSSKAVRRRLESESRAYRRSLPHSAMRFMR